MGTLRESQTRFAYKLGEFLLWCKEKGHEVTLGEAYRPRETAELYSKQGRGSRLSKHTQRLAIDLNYFVDGVYQKDTNAYLELGLKWESLGGIWGGRFHRRDGNHFEV